MIQFIYFIVVVYSATTPDAVKLLIFDMEKQGTNSSPKHHRE